MMAIRVSFGSQRMLKKGICTSLIFLDLLDSQYMAQGKENSVRRWYHAGQMRVILFTYAFVCLSNPY